VIIPNTQNFSYINYTEHNVQFASHTLSQNKINSANFRLLDAETGRPINLNGLDINFTFAIYKKNDYYDHMLRDRQAEIYIKTLEDELKKLDEKLNK
jgi:hypothetical protein